MRPPEGPAHVSSSCFTGFRAPHRSLLTVLLVLAGAAPCVGQTPPAVAALEKQRRLHREIQKARDAGRLLEAARLCAQASELDHVVPLPYTRDDGREALGKQARSFLEKHVKLTEIELANNRSRDLGKVCRKCSGRAFERCRRCGGKGYRDVKAGRRMRRLECRAWDPCTVCDASGRLATVPKVHARLQEVATLAGMHAVKKDVLAGLKAIQAGLDEVPPGLSIPSPKGEQFRKLVGPPPVNPDRIKNKSRLKSLWLNSLPAERREFLYQFALEAATVAHHLRYLEGLKETPSPTSVFKGARDLSVEELLWKGPGLIGKFVSFEAVGKRPDAAFLDAVDFPLEGRINLEGVDPRMMLVIAYSQDDLDRIRTASRLRLSDKADRSLRSYAPRLVMKQLKDVGPGKPIRLWGRVLAHPDGVPGVIVEVWKAAGSEDGQGQ